jgi:hypothetical protein
MMRNSAAHQLAILEIIGQDPCTYNLKELVAVYTTLVFFEKALRDKYQSTWKMIARMRSIQQLRSEHPPVRQSRFYVILSWEEEEP